MKIILTNGTELTPILVTGGPKYAQGANRDTLDFVFPDCSLDEKVEQFTEANCENITIVGDDGSEAIHTGYVIPEIVKKPVEIEKATVDTDAVYENRVFVSMSQRIYAETKQRETEMLLNALLGE
ncbi:MAG: hypothetical protein IJO55_04100 [Lachnospiraceae bacterium]|nr:hypothetical protein [Lachnospiraceae bacterium]